MHVGHPYIPLFKSQRIFDLLVSPPFLIHNPSIHVYAHMYNFHFPFPFSTFVSPCSITMRFVTTKLLIWPVSSMNIHVYTCFYCYILTFNNNYDVIVCMLASSKLSTQFTITSLSLYLPVSEIVKCIAWGCCCFTGTWTLFATVFTVITLVCWLIVVWVSYMPSYVPIAMYGLRLLIVVLQELHCLLNCLDQS